MRNLILTLGAVGLAGCATAGTGPAPGGTCNDAGMSGYVGQPYSAALGTEMQQRSGSGILRVVRYNQVVTMEYSAERLTVSLDQQEKIATARCG